MKTLRYKEIDGYNVVIGITDAETFIDYEATKKIVDKKILDTETSKEIETIKNKMVDIGYQQKQAKQNFKQSKMQDERERLWKEVIKFDNEFKEMQKLLGPLALKLKKEYSDMILANAVHFNIKPTPGYGEIFVDDERAEEIGELMKINNNVVDIDGNLIANNVGRVYWIFDDTWTKQEILKIGVEPLSGAILDTELSETQLQEISEQIERDRIANLSNTEKQAEIDRLIATAQKEAGLLSSELEVTGDPTPVATAQTWLADRIAEIEEKYR